MNVALKSFARRTPATCKIELWCVSAKAAIASAMPHQIRSLYTSPNGDRWFLCRDPEIDRVVVRHEPNGPPGGQASSIEIGRFLTQGQSNPGHQALYGSSEACWISNRPELDAVIKAWTGRGNIESGRLMRGGWRKRPTI